MRTGHTRPAVYEIRVQGRLAPRWASRFDGFTLSPGPAGTTVLTGTVADQSALHGLLQSLCDLGLPLVSVTRPQDETGAVRPGADPAADTALPQTTIPAQDERR